VQRILAGDLAELIEAGHTRMTSYAHAEQFEEAANLRDQMSVLVGVSERFHRLSALRDAGRVVAAAPDGQAGWDIHVIDRGRLVAATHASSSDDARACARAAVTTAEDRAVGSTSTTVEEMSLLARWLESPDVRLINIETPMAWPSYAGSRMFSTDEARADHSTSSRTSGQQGRPVGPAPGVTTVSRLRLSDAS
jgi:DNA polymerase-3 subunit epsilon